MVFTLAENMRGFFVSRPPIVMFMVCLASFAVALITFAYIVKSNDMANPDITEDWNTFLQPLANLEYCVVSEPGAAISNSSQDDSAPEQRIKEKLNKISHILTEDNGDHNADDKDDDGVNKKIGEGGTSEAVGGGVQTPSPTISTPTPQRCDGLVNVSVQVDLELIATNNLHYIAARHNFTFITATMTGKQLGLKGERSKMEANLTLVLPPLGNQSHKCQHGQCNKVKNACVTFIASPCFFPTSPLPEVAEQCLREEVMVGGVVGERENHFHLEVTPGGYIHCINASILTLKHPYDPTLTVMLTMQERSVINLHLMHTSYFLFVMIVTLLCYALVKGRAIKVKVNYAQCPIQTSSGSHQAL